MRRDVSMRRSAAADTETARFRPRLSASPRFETAAQPAKLKHDLVITANPHYSELGPSPSRSAAARAGGPVTHQRRADPTQRRVMASDGADRHRSGASSAAYGDVMLHKTSSGTAGMSQMAMVDRLEGLDPQRALRRLGAVDRVLRHARLGAVGAG